MTTGDLQQQPAIADVLAVAQRYFDAWNQRDPAAVVAAFVEGGTYEDPSSGGPLTGPAIGGYAGALFGAFPDLSFELTSVAPAGPGRVAAEWLMRGTNTAPLANAPPTGRSVALPGMDIVEIEGSGVRSVRGYFDRQTFSEQLGLQVLVQPRSIGPFTFGSGVYVGTGKRTKPGAVSLTSLAVRSDAEVAEVRDYSRRILTEMLEMPGFISFFGGVTGHTLFTVTAWEDPENPRQLLRDGTHAEAMRRFFGPDFAIGGVTTIWVPQRLNTIRVRCLACNRMADAERDSGTCACGATLPEPPPYW